MPPAAVSDQTFGREVLGAALPVLVEFSAEHAPFNATLDSLSAELAGKLKIVKVDVDRHPDLRTEYGVRGLPALILFKHGKPVARRLGGLASKSELAEWVNGALILALATRRTSASRSATEFKLANRLHVVVIPDNRAPVVTQLVWYKVGTAAEPKDFSGLVRFLEHLSFKSLNKITGGDYTRSIARTGGETNGRCDRGATTYWQRVPRDQLRMVMELEADRMANLRLTDEEVATEREVILEMRHSSIDLEPNARLAEKMRAALYRAHTYRLQSIDLANEISRLTRDDVLRFHKLHYAPNNAILVVSGDVTAEEVKQLATETYGQVPANPDFDRHLVGRGRLKVPPQTEVRRVTLEDPRADTARFRRNYAVPAFDTALAGEMEALDVLAKVLAGGTASRLYRKLVIDGKVATFVSGTYLSNGSNSGELALSVVANANDLEAVEAAVDEAIEDIRLNGVSQEEVRCAKKSLMAEYIFSGGDQLDLARRHARAAAAGRTIKDLEDWLAAISRVSAADVRKVAKTYVVPRHSVTGWLSARRDSKRARRTEPPAVERGLG
jgi:zinc protease